MKVLFCFLGIAFSIWGCKSQTHKSDVSFSLQDAPYLPIKMGISKDSTKDIINKDSVYIVFYIIKKLSIINPTDDLITLESLQFITDSAFAKRSKGASYLVSLDDSYKVIDPLFLNVNIRVPPKSNKNINIGIAYYIDIPNSEIDELKKNSIYKQDWLLLKLYDTKMEKDLNVFLKSRIPEYKRGNVVVSAQEGEKRFISFKLPITL